MKKQLNIRINTELLKEVQHLAKEDDRSVTSFIIVAIKERIERLKSLKKNRT